MINSLIRIVKWNPNRKSKLISNFFNRSILEKDAVDIASSILDNIIQKGDEAVINASNKYDKSKMSIKDLLVTNQEIKSAINEVDSSFKKSAKEAHQRIKRFSLSGIRDNWSIKTKHGGNLGEVFIPFDRIGAYIPGGSAPLVSTALMTVTLAKIAGVKEIVACSPPTYNGRIHPYILYALNLSGATEIYNIGGVQAIGAMAYGTKTIKKVRKIVGPGGPYVTAAKQRVYGNVALDMIAGPSEIAILCDTTANPEWIAADLLSQTEHGTGLEKSLLITTSKKHAELIRAEIMKQVKELSRYKIISKILNEGMLIICVDNLSQGIKLINKFAPEHMELVVKDPKKWVNKIKTAGALFIGPWTPESAGDFVAGPSHVLPTGGSCHYFSGLTVDDFRRRMSIVEFKKKDLIDCLSIIEDFGRVETLDGHSKSAKIRFK